MYKINKHQRSSIQRNTSTEGETIEMKMERVTNNKEPITDGAPLIYTERKDGVLPGYDVRTDRWEVALDATDKITASHQAKREQRIAEKEVKIVDINSKKDSGAESTQGEGKSTE